MKPSDGLHVFTNNYEGVVAADIDDAWAVWCNTTGENREDYPDSEWEMLPDDSMLAIWLDDTTPTTDCGCGVRARAHQAVADAYNTAATNYVGFMAKVGARLKDLPPMPQPKDAPGPNGHYDDCPVGHPRKTCAEWCQSDGRGYLCTTEY